MTMIALDGLAAQAGCTLPALAHQHLDAFASQEDYTTLTFRAGDQVADYLVVRGCVGCRTNTCVVGCRATLIRRALEHTLPGLRTRVVAVPLLRQPVAAATVIWPQRNAVPLDRGLLAVSDTVIVAQRVQRRGRGLRVGAGVAIGARDTSERAALAEILRDHHWRALALPPPLLPAVTQLLYRGAIRWGAVLQGPAPLLVGGASTAAATSESVPAPTSGGAMDDAFGRVEPE